MSSNQTDWDIFIDEYIKTGRQQYSTHELTQPTEYTLESVMSITLRLEKESDYREVEMLTREAFWKQERIEKLGSFHESPLYDVDAEKAREYDKLFFAKAGGKSDDNN